MKNIFYLILTTAVLSSCGGGNQKSVDDVVASGNEEAIRAKKTELSQQLNAIEAEMAKLDEAIGKFSNEKLALVTTFEVAAKPFDHFLELQGAVATKQNVLIYPEISGTLEKVYVKEGQRVTKGQLLATIDDGGMGSQLQQLKTQAALSKTTFERQKRLWEQKIGSEIQYLETKANYEAQESAVKQMESQVEKSNIRAPFSGIIDDVIKDAGNIVTPGPGSEVFRIVNLNDMYIEVDVPETYLSDITKGKEAKIYFPVLGDSIITKVRETGNFIKPGNRSFTVQIPVPNKDGNIKPNLTAKVSLNDYSSKEAVLIPQSIISENAEGEQYTFIAEDITDGEGVAKRTIITTGKSQNGQIEILSGIPSGTHVIKEGARSVKDGQKVKILN